MALLRSVGPTFPRDKVCGDGVGPRGVSMLRRMGVERRLRDLSYQPIQHYRIVSTWGDAVRAGVPLFGKGAGYAHVVPRRDLDMLLVEAARRAGDLGAHLLRQILAWPWGNGLMVRLLQRDAGLARGGIGLLSNTVSATWLVRPTIWRWVVTPRRLTGVVSAREPARG